MELTLLQKELIFLLKAYEMEQDEVIGTMILLDTEEKQNKMYRWIGENTSATINEVLEQALKLNKNSTNSSDNCPQ